MDLNLRTIILGLLMAVLPAHSYRFYTDSSNVLRHTYNYGVVCGEYFSALEATMVCKSMGYNSYYKYETNIQVGGYEASLDLMYCREGSEQLSDCEYRWGNGGYETCGWNEGVKLWCRDEDEICKETCEEGLSVVYEQKCTGTEIRSTNCYCRGLVGSLDSHYDTEYKFYGGCEFKGTLEDCLLDCDNAGYRWASHTDKCKFGCESRVKHAVTLRPTKAPQTSSPTKAPHTSSPTQQPTLVPTDVPSKSPSRIPTTLPTVNPSQIPTVLPTCSPTFAPTLVPTEMPTNEPTQSPSTSRPTGSPTTSSPTLIPSFNPTSSPTIVPTFNPTLSPTMHPTLEPTLSPIPTLEPTMIPKVDQIDNGENLLSNGETSSTTIEINGNNTLIIVLVGLILIVLCLLCCFGAAVVYYRKVILVVSKSEKEEKGFENQDEIGNNGSNVLEVLEDDDSYDKISISFSECNHETYLENTDNAAHIVFEPQVRPAFPETSRTIE